MILDFVKLDSRALAPVNAYGTDAGWDLHVLDDTVIPAGGGVDVRTGIAVAIPVGYYGRIVGRSSAFRKRGVVVVEGIIDCGFRGELFSYVWNPTTNLSRELEAGQSVAQLIICQVPYVHWQQVKELPPSPRGEAGFGSSGR